MTKTAIAPVAPAAGHVERQTRPHAELCEFSSTGVGETGESSTGLEETGSGVGETGSGVGETGSGVGEAGSGVGESGSGVGEIGSGVGDTGSGVGETGSGVGETTVWSSSHPQYTSNSLSEAYMKLPSDSSPAEIVTVEQRGKWGDRERLKMEICCNDALP